MKKTSSNQTADVIQLHPKGKPVGRRAEDKWSKQVIKLGYTALPNLLLRAQARLGITPTELNVLAQLAEHWWEAERDPHPAKLTIAQRMKKTPRQIQRLITSLEKKGFIKRVTRYSGRRQTNNGYSFEPLIEELKALEPEFSKEIAQKRLRKRKLEAAAAG